MSRVSEFVHFERHPETGVADAGIQSIGSSAPWLRQRMRELRLELHSDASLAKALVELERLKGWVHAGTPLQWPKEDVLKGYLSASGADFLSKVLRRGEAAGLRGFDSHYAHLVSANPLVTDRHGKSEKARNLSWELVLGALVSTFASNVSPEEPPDIRCDFEGQRVGIAAKMLYSQSATQQLKTIQKGAEQLEKSPCDVGYIIANCVELFPHAEMFALSERATFAHNDEAVNLMGAWSDAFMTAHDLNTWARSLSGSSKLLAIVLFWPAVLFMRNWPSPLVPYYGVHFVAVGGREEQSATFLSALNDACNSALSWGP